jgi:hypothetical protein
MISPSPTRIFDAFGNNHDRPFGNSVLLSFRRMPLETLAGFERAQLIKIEVSVRPLLARIAVDAARKMPTARGNTLRPLQRLNKARSLALRSDANLRH